MDVDRYPILGDPLVEGKEFFTVEGAPIEVGIATEAFEPELMHRAVELIQRGLDGCGWQSAEADETTWIFYAETGDRVVALARNLDGVFAVETIRSRGRNA